MHYKFLKNFISFLFVGILFLGCLSSTSFSQEKDITDTPAEFFFYRCAGCHTVGAGKLTGPDLKVAAQWSGDDLHKAIKKMEKNVGSMSVQDIDQMVSFLKSVNVKERIEKQKKIIELRFQSELPAASFETGQKLFRGQKRLANKGPACISCHHFSNEGGSLGPDLTALNKKSSSVVLQSAIKNASYKVMRSIYEKHPVTTEEALHLSEYLLNPQKVKARFAPTINLIRILATIGFGLFFVLLWILNKNRKGPTREKLVQKRKTE